jgi:hypothetical protein
VASARSTAERCCPSTVEALHVPLTVMSNEALALSARVWFVCHCRPQPLSAESKEMLGSMLGPVAQFFEETNDASKNDETADVPPAVRSRSGDGVRLLLALLTPGRAMCAADHRGPAGDGSVRTAGPRVPWRHRLEQHGLRAHG